MELNVVWSFVLGGLAYGIFLGLGVAGLVAYNLWNNKCLLKAQQALEQEREYCRDSVLDDLNEKWMWRVSKLSRFSTSTGLAPDTRVESHDHVSRSSLHDNFGINSRQSTTLSLSPTLSAGSHDSIEENQQRVTTLTLDKEDDRKRFTDKLSMGGISTLSDSFFEDFEGEFVPEPPEHFLSRVQIQIQPS